MVILSNEEMEKEFNQQKPKVTIDFFIDVEKKKIGMKIGVENGYLDAEGMQCLSCCCEELGKVIALSHKAVILQKEGEEGGEA